MDARDLQSFEHELLLLSAADASPQLQARVARTVARELSSGRRVEWLATVGIAAAVFALVANLSWSVARGTAYIEPARGPDNRTVAQIQELLPELSEAEARRQALVLRGAQQMPNGNAIRRAASLGFTH